MFPRARNCLEKSYGIGQPNGPRDWPKQWTIGPHTLRRAILTSTLWPQWLTPRRKFGKSTTSRAWSSRLRRWRKWHTGEPLTNEKVVPNIIISCLTLDSTRRACTNNLLVTHRLTFEPPRRNFASHKPLCRPLYVRFQSICGVIKSSLHPGPCETHYMYPVWPQKSIG